MIVLIFVFWPLFWIPMVVASCKNVGALKRWRGCWFCLELPLSRLQCQTAAVDLTHPPKIKPRPTTQQRQRPIYGPPGSLPPQVVVQIPTAQPAIGIPAPMPAAPAPKNV
jgi:hypothetical protein